MTEGELLKIKEHIEIHARKEPRAIKITQILWKAVEELETTKELQEENAKLKSSANNWYKYEKETQYHKDIIKDLKKENAELNTLIKSEHEIDARKNNNLISHITKAKELLKRVIEWAGWQSGSKCPSFKEIEKDIKAFLEEKKNEDVKTNNQ